MRLGADVERAWHAEGATIATRKRIVRMLVEEIVVRVEDDGLDLVIRWAGEDHTALRVRKNRNGGAPLARRRRRRRSGPGDGPADAGHGDCGRSQSNWEDDGQGHSWTRTRVASLRNIHSIDVYRRASAPSAAR